MGLGGLDYCKGEGPDLVGAEKVRICRTAFGREQRKQRVKKMVSSKRRTPSHKNPDRAQEARPSKKRKEPKNKKLRKKATTRGTETRSNLQSENRTRPEEGAAQKTKKRRDKGPPIRKLPRSPPRGTPRARSGREGQFDKKLEERKGTMIGT